MIGQTCIITVFHFMIDNHPIALNSEVAHNSSCQVVPYSNVRIKYSLHSCDNSVIYS